MERNMHVTDNERSMHITDNEQGRSIESARGAMADLARQAREQAGAAGEQFQEQGARAGEYLTANVKAYPVTALLLAGAIGYGIAYLIYAGDQPSRAPYRTGPAYLGHPNKMRRDRVPRGGEVVGRDVPDESKERHTEIAVEAGRTVREPSYRR
jgi:hypothetical protein